MYMFLPPYNACYIINYLLVTGRECFHPQSLTHICILSCIHLYTLDKTVIVWNLYREEGNYGIAKKALRGHNHFVSDVVVSSDGMFALSGSWDSTLRLWDLQT